MGPDDTAATGGGIPSTAAAEVAAASAREAGELEFLVGTACSRAINLLMRSDRDAAELADELAFLGEKASRLSVLLRAAGGARGGGGATDRP
jgi:hypothetical protein